MHGIFEDDQMAYVGSHGVPWHKLGFAAPDIMTKEEVLMYSNTDWQIIKEAVKSEAGVEFPGKYLTVRSDTGRPLGLVTDRYKVVQNRQLVELMDAICQDPNGPKFVTGGSLFHGERVWYLAQLPNFIKVTDNDKVKSYILITTGHNGQHQCKIKWVNTRVVCANTLGIAEREYGSGIKFKHTGDIMLKVDDAQRALGIINENFTMLNDIVIKMSKRYPESSDVMRVLNELYPMEQANGEPDQANTRAAFMVTRLWENGQGNSEQATRGTWWTLLNGITEFEDHFSKSYSRDTRNPQLEKKMNDILWGQASSKKERAFNLIASIIE